jgi:hypothetical protein
MKKALFIISVLVVIGLTGIAFAGSLIDNTFRDSEEWLYNKITNDQDKQETPEPAANPEKERPKKPSKPLPVQASGDDDDHYIQPDDYFISHVPFKDQAWIYVHVAKMMTPPTQQTKGEAEFMKVHDGKQMWTKYFWSTRIAEPQDLKLGTKVIMIDVAEGDVYRAPRNKHEARNTNWYIARITDLSDLYKGYFMVSGGYKISVNAARVIVNK